VVGIRTSALGLNIHDRVEQAFQACIKRQEPRGLRAPEVLRPALENVPQRLKPATYLCPHGRADAALKA